jgi:hypothetical protein
LFAIVVVVVVVHIYTGFFYCKTYKHKKHTAFINHKFCKVTAAAGLPGERESENFKLFFFSFAPCQEEQKTKDGNEKVLLDKIIYFFGYE